MEKPIFEGYCPECKSVRNEDVKMLLNERKIWECPNCNLQVLIENNLATIFRHRGQGNIELLPKEVTKFHQYQESDETSYSNAKVIESDDHLKSFLKYAVVPEELYSLNKLIDSYSQYKFMGKAKNEYEYQSQHFNIDFDDESILKKLEKIDRENGYNEQYSYKRLNRLLHHILRKYFQNDDSYLPEMGMAQIQMKLCNKHFSSHTRKIIQAHPEYIRFVLQKFLKDLIGVIYQDKKLFLTFDMQEAKELQAEMTRNLD